MIGTQMNVFGVLLGYLLPVLFVDSYTEGEALTEAQRNSYKHQVFNMFLAVAITSIIITILTIFTFRERPGAPIFSKDGDTGTLMKAKEEFPLMQQLKLCLNNRTYVFTALSSICLMIHLYVLTTVVG